VGKPGSAVEWHMTPVRTRPALETCREGVAGWRVRLGLQGGPAVCRARWAVLAVPHTRTEVG
jgi:hypothetical protein